MTEAIIDKLNLKTRLGYGIGDIAICLYWSGVGLYLLYFYTDVVGISPTLAGLIYGIGMFWDAITDPFMGYMAERTRTKWGVYRPYLLFGNIPLALSFILLFWVPPLEGQALFFFLQGEYFPFLKSHLLWPESLEMFLHQIQKYW